MVPPSLRDLDEPARGDAPEAPSREQEDHFVPPPPPPLPRPAPARLLAWIGLLAYVSLVVQVFVFGTEVNVVRAKQLWPRSMTETLHAPDYRAIELTMNREALAAPDQLNRSRKPTG